MYARFKTVAYSSHFSSQQYKQQTHPTIIVLIGGLNLKT